MPQTNVERVVRNRLCTGCGTCMGVCPTDAVRMTYYRRNRTYVPLIDAGKCTGCGLCCEVCPGTSMTIPQKSQDTVWPDSLPLTFGAYLKAYVAFAKDPKIRYEASSGGVATALSLHMLEHHAVEAIVGTTMGGESALDTRPVLCRTRRDVMNVMGSKYCPAATNTVLKELDPGALRSVAFIGLPCHIQGVHKARQVPPLKDLQNLITLGLLCGGVRGQEGSRWVLRSRGVAPDDVTEIRYRSQSPPGVMQIAMRNGKPQVTVPYHEFSTQFFSCWQPWRCMICADRAAALADISLGDAWHPDLLRENSPGYSLVVVRTEKGLHLLKEAVAGGAIETREIDAETLARSQPTLFAYMNDGIRETLFLACLLGRRVPQCGLAVGNPGLRSVIRRGRLLMRAAILRRMTLSDSFFAFVRSITGPKNWLRRRLGIGAPRG